MEKITSNNGKHQELRYFSIDEFVDAAREGFQRCKDENPIAHSTILVTNRGWAGGTFEEAVELAEYGWVDGLTDAMPIAEQAIEAAEQEIETIELDPQWDVTGSEVDVGRFVQGVPENMVDYELNPVSKVGKVVTLVASSSYSSAVSTQSVMQRGAAITALALALEKTGHETELWADITINGYSGGKTGTVRVLVKGVNDIVDPERIAYAYAHPTFLRRLVFSAQWNYDPEFRKALGMGGSHGIPRDPAEDMPEGTIYLPSLKSNRDVEKPEKFIHEKLAELGLIKEIPA